MAERQTFGREIRRAVERWTDDRRSGDPDRRGWSEDWARPAAGRSGAWVGDPTVPGAGYARSSTAPRHDDRDDPRGGRGYGPDEGAGPGGAGPGREARGERGFVERAADEVASWFGDEDAERRRTEDHRGRGPKSYIRADDRIHEDVCDRLADNPYIDASDIEVRVVAGEVTLTGTVPDRQTRRGAEDTAESISGVTYVQNDLRVRERS